MEQAVLKLRKALPVSVEPVAPSQGAIQFISAGNPMDFWGQFIGALEAGRNSALIDPGWPADWHGPMRAATDSLPVAEGPAILIATSGTSGMPKFCIHDLKTLGSAAEAFSVRFGCRGIINCVNILPENHVGGLMPVLRSAACGGRVHFADYRDAASLRAAPFALGSAAISVVPTQLRRMLAVPGFTQLLREFGLVFVGGAACPPDILQQARAQNIRLAPCYGSTETAAMVTAMDPEEFLSGSLGVGTPLPHADIRVSAEGRICVTAPSVFHGYLPKNEGFSRQPFFTGDIGHLDSSGGLHIDGRADRVIITGGEKVHPEQVESAAVATGLVNGANCIGLPDKDWGHRLELQVTTDDWDEAKRNQLLEALRNRLPRFAVPKAIHRIKAGISVSWK